MSRAPVAGLVVGVWAVIPPYLSAFGGLNVEPRVEFADHVLPGCVVLTASVIAHLRLRSHQPSQLLMFVWGVVIALAGFWMVATHSALISPARQGIVPWGAVAWHGVPGLAVTILGVLWTVRFWGSEASEKA